MMNEKALKSYRLRLLLKGNESAHSRMPQYLDNLLTWSTDNCMVINIKKTKEMILGTANKSPPPLLTISNSPVERVTCFKLKKRSCRETQNLRAGCSKAAQLLDVAKRPIPQG